MFINVSERKPETFGDYRVVYTEENELGKGGQGDVFRGTNTKTGEMVAVKLLFIRDGQEDNMELKNMRKIDHKNIVKLLDYGYKEGFLFLIIELCEDKDLNNFLQNKDISQDLCVSFMQNIAKAVRYLHEEKNILHRDLKPKNILVKKNEVSGPVLKICDVGLAKCISKSLSPLPLEGNVGTSGWQAPETIMLVKDREAYIYGRPADVFSGGLVFWTLVKHRQGEHLSAPKSM